MPDEPSIRRATPEDADAVTGVFTATRAEMTYLPLLHTAEEDRAFFGVVVESCETLVAEAGGRVVGFAALSATRLEHLYVCPEHQSAGIGTRLLARAKALRPDGLDLWVFQPNEGARRFYERQGFRLVEATDGAGNEERVPDARYAWSP